MVEDTMFSGESKNIEYKVSLPDKSEKYMKTIVAFANTQGGKLIVGVVKHTRLLDWKMMRSLVNNAIVCSKSFKRVLFYLNTDISKFGIF